MTPLTVPRSAKPGDTLTLRGPKNHTVTVTMDSRRRWWDLETGTEYAFADESLMTDTSDKPGAGAISFAAYRPLAGAAPAHDFAYSCVAYQVSNPRERADEKLGRDAVTLGAPGWLGRLVTRVVGLFGSEMWDTVKTRWRQRVIDQDLDKDF